MLKAPVRKVTAPRDSRAPLHGKKCCARLTAPFRQRRAGKEGYVADMTEAHQLDAGGGQVISTLAEALQMCSGRAGLMLEFISENISRDVIAAIHCHAFVGRYLCLLSPCGAARG